MARTWLAITVELLGGRGQDLWPPPGRTFAVGPVQLLIDIERAKVAKHVKFGDEFRFVFDLGDNWVHRCTVHQAKIDPVETLGIRAKVPLPYWGWGDLPGQYGRRWASDDGEAQPDPRPDHAHPMQDGQWPEPARVTRADLVEVRKSLSARDGAAFLMAITGRDIDDALQQIAVGAPLLLQSDDQHMLAMVLSFINRLTMRGLPGDEALGEDLLAGLRGEPLPGRQVPVELDLLSAMLDDSEHLTGVYVDLEAGKVLPVGDGLLDTGDPVEVEAHPNRYLWLDRHEEQDRWDDRMAFAAQQRDRDLRRRLEAALDGKGAFRAFRAALEEAGLEERWFVFSADVELGRTRALLAEHDVRAVLP